MMSRLWTLVPNKMVVLDAVFERRGSGEGFGGRAKSSVSAVLSLS